MVSWTLVFTAQAKKDAKKLASSGLKAQAQRLLDVLTATRDKGKFFFMISTPVLISGNQPQFNVSSSYFPL